MAPNERSVPARATYSNPSRGDEIRHNIPVGILTRGMRRGLVKACKLELPSFENGTAHQPLFNHMLVCSKVTLACFTFFYLSVVHDALAIMGAQPVGPVLQPRQLQQ